MYQITTFGDLPQTKKYLDSRKKVAMHLQKCFKVANIARQKEKKRLLLLYEIVDNSRLLLIEDGLAQLFGPEKDI